MNKFLLKTSLLLIVSIFILGCSEEDKSSLYVKFTNNQASQYTINSIQLMDMGSASANEAKASELWSENIIKDNKTIAPGDSLFFTLDIPNGDYSQYRLGVIDDNGNSIMIHEQAGYEDGMKPSITHWGGDDRSVSVTVQKNTNSGLITITAYGDWVGID